MFNSSLQAGTSSLLLASFLLQITILTKYSVILQFVAIRDTVKRDRLSRMPGGNWSATGPARPADPTSTTVLACSWTGCEAVVLFLLLLLGCIITANHVLTRANWIQMEFLLDLKALLTKRECLTRSLFNLSLREINN